MLCYTLNNADVGEIDYALSIIDILSNALTPMWLIALELQGCKENSYLRNFPDNI